MPQNINIFYLYLSKKKIFLLSGIVSSLTKMSNDVLIYKIGDYANYKEVNEFINDNTSVSPGPTETPTPSTSPADPNNLGDNGLSSTNIIIITVISSTLGAVILGFSGYFIFKRYRKTHQSPTLTIA